MTAARKLQLSHFDNDGRFQVFSDGYGHYRVVDTQTGEPRLKNELACDYCCMKAKEWNRAEN